MPSSCFNEHIRIMTKDLLNLGFHINLKVSLAKTAITLLITEQGPSRPVLV